MITLSPRAPAADRARSSLVFRLKMGQAQFGVQSDTTQEELQVQQGQKREGQSTTVSALPISTPHSHIEEETDLEELEQFARTFKQRRKTLRLSQGDVGLAMGKLYGSRHCLCSNTISSFESLNMSFENMCKLKPLLQKWLDDTDPTVSDPAFLSCESLKGIKRKRNCKRNVIKPEIKLLLEKSFLQQPRPFPEETAILAEQLGLEKQVVKNWFCKRRFNEKLVNPTEVIKKRRRVISNRLRVSLEGSFLHQPNPTPEGIALLGEQLGLEKEVVRDWFYNRRLKGRCSTVSSPNQQDLITHDASHSVSTANFSSGVIQIQQFTTDTPVTASTLTVSDPVILSRESIKGIKRKKKFKRIVIKPEIKLLLEKSFLQQPWPLPEEIADVAEQLGLEKPTVLNWFRRRRQEEKLVSQPVVIKKRRRILSFSLRESLENSFLHEPYPTPEQTALLGKKLGLEKEMLRAWFSNRRLTERRRNKTVSSRNQRDPITHHTLHSVSTSNLSPGVTQIQQSTPGTPVTLSTPVSSRIISSTDAAFATTSGQNATPMQAETVVIQWLGRTKAAKLVSATNSQVTATSTTTVIPIAITPVTQSSSDKQVPRHLLSLQELLKS